MPVARGSIALLVWTCAVLEVGCATLDAAPRAADSIGGCVRLALADVQADAGTDKRRHCLATARIAHRCSVAEATLAAYGKEMRDLVTRGDAELADLQAGRAGVRCARAHRELDGLTGCCAASGY